MYEFRPMTLEYAKEIKEWKYDGYMEDIYMDPYFDNYNEVTGEMKGPGNCDGYVAIYEIEVIGLFEYYFKDEVMEIGLALNPKYVGKGLSKEFIKQGIYFGIVTYSYKKDYIKLSVEPDNTAAYNAYKKYGFYEYNKTDDEIQMRIDL